MTDLADKMKHWPILAAHRMTEIEAVLLSFDERLAALEPHDEPSEAPSDEFIMDEPVEHEDILPVEAVPPEEEPNPLDGERSDS